MSQLIGSYLFVFASFTEPSRDRSALAVRVDRIFLRFFIVYAELSIIEIAGTQKRWPRIVAVLIVISRFKGAGHRLYRKGHEQRMDG